MKHIILITVALLFCSSLFSQENKLEKSYTINYVANIPEAPIGISMLAQFKNTPVGIYMDIKWNFGEKLEGEDYSGTISIDKAENDYEDPFRGEKQSTLFIVDGGISFSLNKNKNFLAYGGIGFFSSTVYRQYYDPSHILSESGNYYIEDKSKSESGVNFTSGIIYIFKSGFTVQSGIDANPLGVNLGIGYSF